MSPGKKNGVLILPVISGKQPAPEYGATASESIRGLRERVRRMVAGGVPLRRDVGDALEASFALLDERDELLALLEDICPPEVGLASLNVKQWDRARALITRARGGK